ncbi:MAG: hypothetical protein IID41_11645 [Planctomycetes bacterium]|nr:hypothetical protein [Planctomycetota bacterium]
MARSVVFATVIVLIDLAQATAAATFFGLGYLPSDDFSRAFGVSADGTVVVGVSEFCCATFPEAYRWTSSEGMVGLARIIHKSLRLVVEWWWSG